MNAIAQIEKIEPQDIATSANVATPMMIIDRAIASGASVETLERLMVLQERYEASQARRDFDESISAAKAEIKPIVKNRKVDFTTQKGRTNYAYEDLAGISETVDPILANYGLSYRYRTTQNGARLAVTCIMSHRRGHREETTLEASNDESGNKNSIQAVGSTATYLQRYTLKLALGLAAAKDIDGKLPDDEPKPIDDAQFRYLQDLIEKAEADEPKLLVFLKAEKLETLTQAQYKLAEAALRKKINAKAAEQKP